MQDEPLWVFGYGSLMWNPGFEYSQRKLAVLPDYARSFCMWSIHYRGTSDRPGLVLALDRTAGATCQGLAYSVPAAARDATLGLLRERELISSAYLERFLQIDLKEGGRTAAVTYVVDPDHVQYCGGLPLEEQAEIIAAATGTRGPNTEYLYNTARHLEELGIEDADLSWLSEKVQNLAD